MFCKTLHVPRDTMFIFAGYEMDYDGEAHRHEGMCC